MPNSLPTDQRILDAAQGHGYHGVSYAAVAAHVGVRKARVFHHFPTKEDLAHDDDAHFDAVADRLLPTFQADG